MNLRPTSMSSSTVSALRKCGMWGIDIATATTSYGFQAAKTGTKLGVSSPLRSRTLNALTTRQFSITRGIASAVIGVTSPIVDLAFFDKSGMSSLVIGGAVATAITFAEQLTLAPLNIGEYITSGSLLAAHSSINVLSVIFPGSSEASFSLASFITLVKREWNDPEFATNLPDRKFGLTEIARAVVAWVALQGVTQEWQEQVWLKSLKEIKVEDHPIETIRRQRVGSRVRVTSDIIFPGNLGQLISADIGEAPVPYARAMSHTPLPKGPGCTSSSAATSRRPRVEQLKPKNPTEMKATLRRLSKIVLAGYGGASMWFFGVGPDFTSSPVTPFASGPANKKTSEEAQLENAIDASEAEAFGNTPNAPSPTPSPGTQNPNTYSWWDMLLGKHDQEIFEHYANAPVEQQTQQARHAQETWRRKKAQMKTETVHGMEHQMPRFWVLTDHGRSQIVLVLRGTMSLNELAVDLTCEPVEFDPAGTSYQEEDDVSERPSTLMPSHFPFPTTPSFRRFPRQSMASISSISSLSQPRYLVHSGMLKMARMMGEAGKPVHRAVQDALHKNADYELLLCGHSLGAGVGAVLGLVRPTPDFDNKWPFFTVICRCGLTRKHVAPFAQVAFPSAAAYQCIASHHRMWLRSSIFSDMNTLITQMSCRSRPECARFKPNHLPRILARCCFSSFSRICQGYTQCGDVAL